MKAKLGVLLSVLVPYVVAGLLGWGLVHFFPVMLVPTLVWAVGVPVSFGVYALVKMTKWSEGFPDVVYEYVLPLFWVVLVLVVIFLVLVNLFHYCRDPSAYRVDQE